MRTIRSPIRRRSVSIWVSPGPPRKPKPPRCRSRWVHERTRRERWYFRCASSTCSAPSAVRARWPKISRMSPVRSMTLQPKAFSRLRCCAGDKRAIHDDKIDRLGLHMRRDRLDLALADVGRRPDLVQTTRFRRRRPQDRWRARGLPPPRAAPRDCARRHSIPASHWDRRPGRGVVTARRSRSSVALRERIGVSARLRRPPRTW